MNKKQFIAIASTAAVLSGCAVTYGDTDFVDATPIGDHIAQESRNFPSIGSAFPLKIANPESLDKKFRDALEPYFQTNGDYPGINISIDYTNNYPTISGASDGYSASGSHLIWSSDITLKDWTTSNLIFAFGAKCDVGWTHKHSMSAPKSLTIINPAMDMCINDLSVEIVTKLQSRRSEIDSLSEKYTAWKKKQ